VFGDAFEPDVRRRAVADLRTIGRGLGDVRDIDVRLLMLAADIGERSGRRRAALDRLGSIWRADREASHARLVTLLRSTTFERSVIDTVAIVRREVEVERPVEPHRPATLRTRMPARLWSAYQAVWAFEGSMAEADVPTLHRLRIEAKWLRYTVEFVRPPLEPEATALLRRVVALQDRLGDIHDLHAAGTLAAAFANGPERLTKAERSATTRFARRLETRAARLQRDLGPDWRRVNGAGYRRLLGSAIARF
jgi:CHAD domain-containing protein